MQSIGVVCEKDTVVHLPKMFWCFNIVLIPGNICSCGNNLNSIGHPQSCYAYVLCSEIEGTVYPFGISCPLEQCRNSITGVCSSNCSQAVCSETVPSGNFVSLVYRTYDYYTEGKLDIWRNMCNDIYISTIST